MNTRTLEPELVFAFLDELLGVEGFPDYDGAWNGLQVEGGSSISAVAAAVDASVATVEGAVQAGADLLLVHHGLFWDPDRTLVGPRYRRIAPLLRQGIALYAAHLPLDAHERVGNAAVLARALGFELGPRFGSWNGIEVGWEVAADEDREALRKRVSDLVQGPVRLIGGGPDRVRRMAVVTGGGGGFIRAAAGAGIDTLLTGEGAHHTFTDAMEHGVNVLYAGHYATEVWGVRAVAELLESEFGLPWTFLDVPSGL